MKMKFKGYLQRIIAIFAFSCAVVICIYECFIKNIFELNIKYTLSFIAYIFIIIELLGMIVLIIAAIWELIDFIKEGE